MRIQIRVRTAHTSKMHSYQVHWYSSGLSPVVAERPLNIRSAFFSPLIFCKSLFSSYFSSLLTALNFILAHRCLSSFPRVFPSLFLLFPYAFNLFPRFPCFYSCPSLCFFLLSIFFPFLSFLTLDLLRPLPSFRLFIIIFFLAILHSPRLSFPYFTLSFL